MNALVKTALDKLIQDEKFRTELAGLLDNVNRAATDPELVSRETVQERAGAVPDAAAPETSKFDDVKAELLADPNFLKGLLDALTNMNQPEQTERAALSTNVNSLRETVETLTRTVKELGVTINEHDGVITAMAEKALIAEGEKSQTLRARTEQPEDQKKTPASTMETRAAKVLTRMGAKNA
jgi:hypothetical protein